MIEYVFVAFCFLWVGAGLLLWAKVLEYARPSDAR